MSAKKRNKRKQQQPTEGTARAVDFYREHIQPKQRIYALSFLGVILVLVLIVSLFSYLRYKEAEAWRLLANAKDDPVKLEELAQTYDGSEVGMRAAFLLGERAQHNNQPIEAEAHFRKFLERYTRGVFSSKAKVGLGYVLETQQKYKEAETLFASVAQEETDSVLKAEASLGAGRCAQLRGDDLVAKRWFDTAVATADENSYYHLQAVAALKRLRSSKPSSEPKTEGPEATSADEVE